jgi:hypothetical protein
MKRKTHPSKHPNSPTDSKIHTYSVEMPRLPEDYTSLMRNTGPFYAPYQVYRSGPETSTLLCKQRGYIGDTFWKREGWVDVDVVVPANSTVEFNDAISMCRNWDLKSITITPPSEAEPFPARHRQAPEDSPCDGHSRHFQPNGAVGEHRADVGLGQIRRPLERR